MCKTLSSFEQLGSFLREMPKVETSLFEVLSDNKASEVAKKKAAEDLERIKALVEEAKAEMEDD